MLQFTEIEHLPPNEFPKCRAREEVGMQPCFWAASRQQYCILCRRTYFRITEPFLSQNSVSVVPLGLPPQPRAAEPSVSSPGSPCTTQRHSSSTWLTLPVSVPELGAWAALCSGKRRWHTGRHPVVWSSSINQGRDTHHSQWVL